MPFIIIINVIFISEYTSNQLTELTNEKREKKDYFHDHMLSFGMVNRQRKRKSWL